MMPNNRFAAPGFAALLLLVAAQADAMPSRAEAMPDDELSSVHGGDGIAFNLGGFSVTSSVDKPLNVIYSRGPAGARDYLWSGDYIDAACAVADNPTHCGTGMSWSRTDITSNLDLMRSDDESYRIDVQSRGGTLADVIVFRDPLNKGQNGDTSPKYELMAWQRVTDWGVVDADSTKFFGGAMVERDRISYGSTLSLTTPTASMGTDAIVFGYATRTTVGEMRFLPRVNAKDVPLTGTVPETGAFNDYMRFGVIRTGAATIAPTVLVDPITGVATYGAASMVADVDPTADARWVMSDVTNQPGTLTAGTTPMDGSTFEGQAYLQFKIDWPANGYTPPTGGVFIDNIRFNNGTTGTPTDLGASRIGNMQINYMSVRLYPGH